jgi:hypothetical protein
VNHVTAVVGVEVRGVAEDLEETTNALFCLFLGLLLLVDGLVGLVQMSENFVDHF